MVGEGSLPQMPTRRTFSFILALFLFLIFTSNDFQSVLGSFLDRMMMIRYPLMILLFYFLSGVFKQFLIRLGLVVGYLCFLMTIRVQLYLRPPYDFDDLT